MKLFFGIFLGVVLGYGVGVMFAARGVLPLVIKGYKKELEKQSKLLIELGRQSEADSLLHVYNNSLDSVKNSWTMVGVKFDN